MGFTAFSASDMRHPPSVAEVCQMALGPAHRHAISEIQTFKVLGHLAPLGRFMGGGQGECVRRA